VLFVATVSVLVAAAGSIVFQQGKFGEPGTWCDPHDMDGMLLTIVVLFFCCSDWTPQARLYLS
jgi:hypothetical protein